MKITPCEFTRKGGRTGLVMLLTGTIILLYLSITFILALMDVIGFVDMITWLDDTGMILILSIVGVSVVSSGITLKVIEYRACSMTG